MTEREAITVREARLPDLPPIIDIYNHYIVHELTPFAVEPCSVESRIPWFKAFDAGRYRLLVALGDSGLLGWACSSRYRPTPAFDHAVEASVYIHPDGRGRGVGSLLYTELFALLASQPVHTVLAGIAQPNPASVALHRKFGFVEVGTFREYARKRDVLISSTWFQRMMT